MTKSFTTLLDAFAGAVRAGDGAAFSGLFTPVGVYDDVFYGVFQGRAAISDMLEKHFHRDGENFLWRLFDPVSDGATGYARWLFSYDCKLSHIRGKRIYMDGVGLFKLRDGLIARYEDAARTAELLHQVEMPDEKQKRVVGKMFDRQMSVPGWAEHVALARTAPA